MCSFLPLILKEGFPCLNDVEVWAVCVCKVVTKVFILPIRVSNHCCCFFNCLVISSLWVEGMVAAAVFSFPLHFDFSYPVFILCLPTLLQEGHIVNCSICMAIFNTISFAFLAAMEQSVLVEFLFLEKWDLIGEFVSYLRQVTLNPCGKRGDCFFLSLDCSVEVSHQ